MGQGQSAESFRRPSRPRRRRSKSTPTLAHSHSSRPVDSHQTVNSPTPGLPPPLPPMPDQLHHHYHQHYPSPPSTASTTLSPLGSSPAPSYSTLASTRSGSDRSLLAPPVFVAPPPPTGPPRSPPQHGPHGTAAANDHLRHASIRSAAAPVSNYRQLNRSHALDDAPPMIAPGLRNNSSPPKSPSSAARVVELVRTKSHRLVRKASTALSSATSPSASRRRAATQQHPDGHSSSSSRLRVVALSSSMTDIDSSHDDNISLPTNVHQALHVEYDSDINKFRGVPRAWHDSFRDFGFTDECLDHLDSLEPHLAPLPPLPPLPPNSRSAEASGILPRTNRSMINLPSALSNASTFFSRRRNASATAADLEPAVTAATERHTRSRTDSAAVTEVRSRAGTNGIGDGSGLLTAPSIVGHVARPAEPLLPRSVSTTSLRSGGGQYQAHHQRHRSGPGTTGNPLYPIQDDDGDGESDSEDDGDHYAQQRYRPSAAAAAARNGSARYRSTTADAADSSRLSGNSTSSSMTITASRMTRGAPPIITSPASTSRSLNHSRSASSSTTVTPRASVMSQHPASSQQQQHRRPSTAPSTTGPRRGSTDSTASSCMRTANDFDATASSSSMSARRRGHVPPPLPPYPDGYTSRPESPAVPRTPLTPITPRVPSSFASDRSAPKTPNSVASITPTRTRPSAAAAAADSPSHRSTPDPAAHVPPSPSVSTFLASLSATMAGINDSATDLTRTSSPTIHPLLISMIEANKFKSDHAPAGAAIGTHSPASLTPIGAHMPASSTTLSDMLAEAAAGPAVPAAGSLTIEEVTDAGDPRVLFVDRKPYAEAGRGVVYTAQDAAVAGAKVAIKVVDRDDKWIVSELAVLRRARHANIVPLVGAFLDPSEPKVWVVTEMYDGGSLADMLCDLPPVCAPAGSSIGADGGGGGDAGVACARVGSRATIASVMFPLLNALSFMHSRMRVVHGDLRSDNVLVACDGRVALAPHWRSSAAIGARVSVPNDQPVYWMAPEVAKATATAAVMGAAESVVAAAALDVYALGMVLVELVTGGAYPDMDEEDEMDAVARVALQGAMGGPRELVMGAVGSGESDVVLEFFDKCTAVDPAERAAAGDMLAGCALVKGWTEDKCRRQVRQLVYLAGSTASGGAGGCEGEATSE